MLSPRSTADALCVRRASPADLPAIAELVRLAEGSEYDIKIVPEHHVWIAFAGDKAVGITTLESRILRWGDCEYRAGYWTNLFVHEDYRKTTLYTRLVFTMFRGAEEAGLDFMYAAVRRAQVAQAHLACGMCKIGELPVFGIPLRPASLIAKYKRLGGAVVRLSPFPDSAYAVWLRLRRWSPSRGFSVAPLEWNSSEVPQLLDMLRHSAVGRVHQVWTPDSFRHRFKAPLDGTPYTLLGVRREGCLVGGAVYRVAERKQIRAGIVLVLFHVRDESRAAQVCMREVERRAWQEGAEVLLCLGGGPGYVKSPETYILMWRKSAVAPEDLPPADLSQWSFAFADHDAF